MLAGRSANQSLAGSQCRGCIAAEDDVTENTICQRLSHRPRSLFLGRLYFRNNRNPQRFILLQGFIPKQPISVTHTYNPRTNTHADTHVRPLSAEYLSSREAFDIIDMGAQYAVISSPSIIKLR